MRLARWFDILDSIGEALADEEQDRLRHGAFVGWQLVCAVGGSKVGTFGSYAASLGLSLGGRRDGGPPARGVPQVSKEEAMANAERSLEYFRTHPRRELGGRAQTAARAKRRAQRRARRAVSDGR